MKKEAESEGEKWENYFVEKLNSYFIRQHKWY